MSTSAHSTGYGPRPKRTVFDGDEKKYEIWEVKFLGYMRLRSLLRIIDPVDPNAVVDEEKNAEAFAELIQCLDDRSLSLIIRDAKDDGKAALVILRNFYLSQSKPRIISLYTELTTLKLGEESITGYIIRAESAAQNLKSAKETLSDSLLTAMILKGLPSEFNTFRTFVTQRDKQMTFAQFKISLRSIEEEKKAAESQGQADYLMKINCGSV